MLNHVSYNMVIFTVEQTIVRIKFEDTKYNERGFTLMSGMCGTQLWGTTY